MANPAPNVSTRFQPGRAANPGGKPQNARNRLTAEFVNRLADDFTKHGAAVIRRVREEEPAKYLAVVAALMPREVIVDRPFDGMSDDEIASAIAVLREIAARAGGTLALPARSGAGETTQH